MSNSQVCKYLKELRGVHKTQEEYAKEIGVSNSYYQKVERGLILPSRNFISKLKKSHPDLNVNIFFQNEYANNAQKLII